MVFGPMIWMIARVLGGLGGIGLVILTIVSAVRTVVLPRSAPEVITRFLFRGTRRIFHAFLKHASTYDTRDRVMALYAPLTLVILPGMWLSIVMLGYTGIYWMLGVEPLEKAMRLSISSLVTLGFESLNDLPRGLVMFSEAAIGMVLVALMISYLPAMYSSFSKRETAVTLLEVRAGSPPTALEMLSRYNRLGRMQLLSEMWVQWEVWFAELEETHTSLAALPFFRSPRPHRSWVTAAGAILDTAALANSTLDIPHDVQADICIRAGFIALRHIADFFTIPYDPDPRQGDPISITREEYDDVCVQLEAAGIHLKLDREQAWLDFAGWRVNYDTALLALAALTMAPYAPWSSDRSPVYARQWAKEQKRSMGD